MTENLSHEPRVIIVTRNAYDLLTEAELDQLQPGEGSRESWDRYILVVMDAATTAAYILRDGVSQDDGPDVFDLPKDFDFVRAEEELQEMLDDHVRTCLDAEMEDRMEDKTDDNHEEGDHETDMDR